MIILLLIAFALIAIMDLPKLIKEKQRKEIVVYLSLFAFAFTISFLLVIGIQIPSPVTGIKYIVKDILHLNYN